LIISTLFYFIESAELEPDFEIIKPIIPILQNATDGLKNDFKRNLTIVNGYNANAEQFPYIVWLLIETADGFASCGGSILSTDIILTAAHCLQDVLSIEVYAGGIDRSVNDGWTIANAKQWVSHPEYLSSSSSIENDIGLIQLETKLRFSKSIKPAKLDKKGVVYSAEAEVCGWGRTSDSGTGAVELQYTTVHIIDTIMCKRFWLFVDDNIICAISPSASTITATCSGDSGGPIFQKNIQVGIVSFGPSSSCLTDYPTGFTAVKPYNGWITEMRKIAKKGQDWAT
jgi:trypsin